MENKFTIKEISDLLNIDKSKFYIIDVESLNFDSNKTFIMLRNLELDSDKFELKINQNDIDQWLLDYIKSPINVDIKQFNVLWNKHLYDFLTYKFNIFIDCNQLLFNEICNFLYSLIYFATTLLGITTEFKPYDKNNMQFNANILNIYKDLRNIEVLLLKRKNLKQYNYNIFNKQNFLKILSSAKTSINFIFMYGKITSEWNLYKNILNYIK